VVKTRDKSNIAKQIKAHFNKNQSWLAKKIGRSEGYLSKRMTGFKEWTQDDLDRINKVLGTEFEIEK
jgi:plasmid maintenance system antidote protein VapI